MPLILTDREVREDDIKTIGGKGINLAIMKNADFPVPESFFVTTEAYQKFIDVNNLRTRIEDVLKEIDFSEVSSLDSASSKINNLIMSGKVSESIREKIKEGYNGLMYGKDILTVGEPLEFLKAGKDLPFVAVRSSAVTEDIKGASSAGQYETILNVRGMEKLMTAVKKCWASLYGSRAMYYRHKNNQPLYSSIGVIVQKMVNSKKAGVTFTIDPSNPVEGKDKIIIEATWGLGEYLVQGRIEPDHYVVNKNTGEIIEKKIGKKEVKLVRDMYTGNSIEENVPSELVEAQILTDNEIVTVAAYCKKIEQHYKFPQDIEWAFESGRLYIVQSRAVTTLEAAKEHEEITGTVILEGFGSSSGVAKGPVKVIHNISELDKIQKGDILVTTMTSPDMVSVMEKSAGIVTNEGGQTCHASIVSRELGIPCIVGTKKATEILKDGMIITVDAAHGKVYSGEVAVEEEKVEAFDGRTTTKIKTNVAFAKTAEGAAAKSDGVGLMRLEHLLTRGGYHPVEYIRLGKTEELIQILVDGVGAVARAFFPKPVWVRSLDARTDEFRNMVGGENEAKEANPMLGWHGIRRTVNEPEILKAELTAIKRLYDQGLKNVEIMLPFIIDVSELREAKKIAREMKIDVKFGIMVETPAAALTIEEFCKDGITFASFGTNDLTQLTLGVDRNNERLGNIFNEKHASVLRLINFVIKTCKKYGVETSICGEAGSDPEMTRILVEYGIDSISANIDAVDIVRKAAFETERRLLLEMAR